MVPGHMFSEQLHIDGVAIGLDALHFPVVPVPQVHDELRASLHAAQAVTDHKVVSSRVVPSDTGNVKGPVVHDLLTSAVGIVQSDAIEEPRDGRLGIALEVHLKGDLFSFAGINVALVARNGRFKGCGETRR